MELTLIALLKYYVIFCLTTTLCCFIVQLEAIQDAGIKFSIVGWITYIGMTFSISMVIAPMLFLVFIFARESYYYNILNRMLEKEVDTDD